MNNVEVYFGISYLLEYPIGNNSKNASLLPSSPKHIVRFYDLV